MKQSKEEEWFIENVGEGEKRSYLITEVLCKTESKYQQIEIFKLANQGITLVLDGHARVFEIDEFIYHEAITYPALSRHPNAKSVLVIGDGDGGIIRELLKNENLNRIDWVEIDEKVINVCERHLPSFPCHYRNDERVNLIIADGLKYLEKCNFKYDIIYMSVTAKGDSCYSEPLHEKSIYTLLKRVLKSDGIATLSLDEFSPNSINKYFERIQNVKQWFREVYPFYIGLPSFGTNWGFVLGGDVERQDVGIVETDNLRFYCREEDNFMFNLPKYLK